MTLASRHNFRNETHGQARTLWLYTLSDLMSLLLCFFVLLFAMSQTQNGPWKQIFGATVHDDTSMMTEERSDMEATRNAAALSDARDANYLQVLMTERLAQLSLEVPVTISRVSDGVLLAMPADDLFATGAARDHAALATKLKPLADLLTSVPNALSVVLSSPRSAEPEAGVPPSRVAKPLPMRWGMPASIMSVIETRDLSGAAPQIALLLRDRETTP